MKRSIAVIALVIAAIWIIPLVAQTGASSTSCPKAKVCDKAQGECQGQGQGCQEKCEQGEGVCEDCPKAVNGECQSCDKAEDEADQTGQGCGMGQGMMRQGCGMGRGCGMGQGQPTEI